MGVRVREKDGNWYVFVNRLRKRKAKKVGPGEAGKRLAYELADRLRIQLAFGEDIDPPKETPDFATYAEDWLKSVSTLRKTGTWETYKRHMDRIWIPALGKLRLDQITRAHVKKVLIDLQQDHGFSRRYMLAILTSLQSCLAEAVDEELVSQNVANRQTRNISKTVPKEIEVFTEPDLKHLLQTALEYSADMYVKILIMARTGMREGEMLALQVEDLDFDKDQIFVRQTWGSQNTQKKLLYINSRSPVNGGRSMCVPNSGKRS